MEAKINTHIPTFFITSFFLFIFIFIPIASFANTFIFNPRTHSYTAINDNGHVVKSGRASGGRPGRRTPVGHFSTIRRQGADCYSSKFHARMPYCNFFLKYYAVHGFYSVPRYNASHGCIRLPIADAKWLFYNFFHIGTRVIVKPY